MKAPLVSVIIPVYNAERFLAAAVESVIAQTYKEWELILIDDGSLDRSNEICDQYAAQYAHIKVIHQSNQGVSAARNAGLEVAQGEFIAFVDADDVIAPGYLQILFSRQKETDADLVGLWFKYVDVHLKSISEYGGIQDGSYMAEHLHHFIRANSFFFGVVWGKLLRKSLIDEYNLRFCNTMNYGEDTLFICCYASICNKVVCISKSLYLYRQYGTSLSHQNIEERLKLNIQMKHEFQSFAEIHHIHTEFVQATSSLWNYHILENMALRPHTLSEMRRNLTILYNDRNFCEYVRNYRTVGGRLLRLYIYSFLFVPRILTPYLFVIYNKCVWCVIKFRH